MLFPVNYWPMIRRYAAEHQLDPYMIAALIAQESTFTADVEVGRQRVRADADRAGHRPPLRVDAAADKRFSIAC